mgnify:CR=1 FL=1
MQRRMAALMCDDLIRFVDVIADGDIDEERAVRRATLLRVLLLEGPEQVRLTYGRNKEDDNLPDYLVHVQAPCWDGPQLLYGGGKDDAFYQYEEGCALVDSLFVEFHREQFERQFGLPAELARGAEGEYRLKIARDAFAAFLESKRDKEIA